MVTVVIPNYNHAPFLSTRIDSVLRQTFTDFEIILMDDASTDGSQELLEGYRTHPRVSHLLLNTQNSGSPFRQWQRAFELARGEYIWIAESDDWADPTFLSTLVPYLAQHPTLALVHCANHYIDQSGVFLADRNPEHSPIYRTGYQQLYAHFAFRNTLHNVSSALFRTRCIPPIPDWVQNMRYCGDWMFWAMLMSKGDYAYVPTKLNYYRQHAQSISGGAKHKLLAILEGIFIHKMLWNNPNVSIVQRIQVVTFWIDQLIDGFSVRRLHEQPGRAFWIAFYILWSSTPFLTSIIFPLRVLRASFGQAKKTVLYSVK